VTTLTEWATTITARVTDTYEPQVTHVITKLDKNNRTPLTKKYLYAVAHRKWIVDWGWITSSMRSLATVLAEEN
jgi:hypothetical protein